MTGELHPAPCCPAVSVLARLNVSPVFASRYDALCILLRHSKNVRYWFAHNVLFAYPNRFSEYLLECPSAEVRGAFAKLIVFIAHFSLQDGPCPSPTASPGSSAQVGAGLGLTSVQNGVLRGLSGAHFDRPPSGRYLKLVVSQVVTEKVCFLCFYCCNLSFFSRLCTRAVITSL